MRFGFAAEQRSLAEATRDVLAAHCPPSLVRAAAAEAIARPGGATASARRGELWRQLAALGLLGVVVPETYGGLGLTLWDAVLAVEELGRAVAPGPIVETALVGVTLLDGTPLAQRWLPAVAAGEAVLTVQVRAGQYAVDADIADVLLAGDAGVGGRPGARGAAGLAAVPAAAAGLVAQPALDPSRRLFSTSPSATAGLGFAAGAEARRRIGRACEVGAVATAAQLVGIGQRLLDTTVEYACSRRQFGRPIGSFQAVKHQLADVLIALEFARPLVYRAAFTLSRDAQTAGRDASAAKAVATEAADLAARVALQVHGAIGYTAELDLQLWLKRAWALRSAWGDAAWHRRQVGAALLAPGGDPEPVAAPVPDGVTGRSGGPVRTVQ